MNTHDRARALADWIFENAEKLSFGEIVLKIQVHNKLIKQVDKTLTIRERPEDGGGR